MDPINNEIFMRRCIVLAELARASGEAPVGALLVHEGEILAEGIERTHSHFDVGAHAEVLAIRAACQKRKSTDLSGCTLYTTVEPCVLCSYVIRKTGIGRVVYGIPTDQAGGATSKYDILQDSNLAGWPPPPRVTAGVLADECRRALNH